MDLFLADSKLAVEEFAHRLESHRRRQHMMNCLWWRIALAVLYRAMQDLMGYLRGCEPESLYHDVLAWMANDDSAYVFSFRNCARAAGLDPDALREQVRRKIRELRPSFADVRLWTNW